MLEYITDGLEISSDDSDQENSNEKKLNIELLAMKMLKNWTFIAYSFQKWVHTENFDQTKYVLFNRR